MRVPQFNFAHGEVQFASGRKPTNGWDDGDDEEKKPRGFHQLSHAIRSATRYAIRSDDERTHNGKKMRQRKTEFVQRENARHSCELSCAICCSASYTAKSFLVRRSMLN